MLILATSKYEWPTIDDKYILFYVICLTVYSLREKWSLTLCTALFTVRLLHDIKL